MTLIEFDKMVSKPSKSAHGAKLVAVDGLTYRNAAGIAGVSQQAITVFLRTLRNKINQENINSNLELIKSDVRMLSKRRNKLNKENIK